MPEGEMFRSDRKVRGFNLPTKWILSYGSPRLKHLGLGIYSKPYFPIMTASKRWTNSDILASARVIFLRNCQYEYFLYLISLEGFKTQEADNALRNNRSKGRSLKIKIQDL